MNGFSLVPNVDFSFPCRNWFPRINGMFSMLDGNSAWLRTVFFCESGEMLCVEQHCSEALPWNCFCWVFSVVRVRWSSVHISMSDMFHSVSAWKFWMKYYHPVAFLEVYNGENSHTLQFCCYFIHRSCMVWLSLQGFIQVPWIQTYPQFLLNCVIW